ncbi:MAG TPA: endonuclease/exonuclease/phosphatase family protein [Humibacter sp.]|nr:endonuclease/exonuclease/phosphatase family protein [Humibacter sp.]
MPKARRRPSDRGIVVGVLGAITALVLLTHTWIPDVGGYISLLETFLPWLWVPIVALVVAAVIGRTSLFAWIGVSLAAITWVVLFVPTLVPHDSHLIPNLHVVSENIDADNHDPAATIRSLVSRDADIVALQELDAKSTPIAERMLTSAYPHSYVVGTIGVWSKTPLTNGEPLELGLGWNRALSVDVSTADGPVRVFEVHMASVRIGEYRQRDTMLAALKNTLDGASDSRVIVVGDFNAASTDREFRQLEQTVTEAPTSTLDFGFTWPSTFPFARVDHLLTRGLTTVTSTVLPANGSDHRGIDVSLR